MMPCTLCGSFDADGKLRRGLKQKGKTKRDGTRGERRYVCQDCGAESVFTFDTATKEFGSVPVLHIVHGSKD